MKHKSDKTLGGLEMKEQIRKCSDSVIRFECFGCLRLMQKQVDFLGHKTE